MKTRGSFAFALALILAALPAFAGVCDLRCASAQGASRRSEVEEMATHSAAGFAPDATSCPLHAADTSRQEPIPSSPTPCHGQRHGGSGALMVAVAASAAPSPITPRRSPTLEASPVAYLERPGAKALRSGESVYDRKPRFAPLLSILRL